MNQIVGGRARWGTRAPRLLVGALILLAGPGCDPESADIGRPCERKSECAGDLICDVHEGRGSCQLAHAHDEDGDPGQLAVRWIEVSADDYKLELEPPFDPEITEYTALADGPEVEVYIDVMVDRDEVEVTVDGDATVEAGYRTWRSAPGQGLFAPSVVTIEVRAEGEDGHTLEIELLHR